MRLGGVGDRSRLSSSNSGIGKTAGCTDISAGERYMILRVRACCTALPVSLFCEANIQSMSIDCFRLLAVIAMTIVERT